MPLLQIDFKQQRDKRFIMENGYGEYGTSIDDSDFEKIKSELIKDRNFILYKTEKKQ